MINIAKIYEKLVESGEDWAHKAAASDLLHETRKSVLSQIMQDYEGSHAAKECQALADNRYLEHVRAMVDASRAANLAKVRWEAQKMYVELVRTKAASERAAMREAT